MTESNQPIIVDDEEVSMKDLFEKGKEYFYEILRNWWLVLLIALPILAFFLYQAVTTPTTYKADLTFMVEEDAGPKLGGMANILGSFGLGGGTTYDLDKIIELLKSRKIIQSALFEKTTIDGKEDYYANHLIRKYDYHEKWADDTTGIKNFLYVRDNIDAFTNPENRVLKILYSDIIGNPAEGKPSMLESEITVLSGILTLSFTSVDQNISVRFLKLLYEKLSKYYVDKTVEKSRETYELIKSKTDSIKGVLDSKEYQLANFKDTQRGLYLKTKQLKEMQLERDVRMLNVMYGESIKNLEMAEFALSNKTPFIQAIDLPIAPLKPQSSSILMAIITGLMIGGILGVGFVFIRKIFRDAFSAD